MYRLEISQENHTNGIHLRKVMAELTYNCVKCKKKITTNVDPLKEARQCFTCFRNGIGKRMFESGDFFA